MEEKRMISGLFLSTALHILLLTITSMTLFNNAAANFDAVKIIETSLKTNIYVKGEADPSSSIMKRMEQVHVPGISVAVIHDGKIDWAKGYGIAIGQTKVDTNTLFQAASISKPVAALAALKLVEQGKLQLDVDVNQYLEGWKVEGKFLTDENPVTLRHLLTHTGGIAVRWFPGYATGTDLPTTADVLAGKGNTDKVEVDQEPGSNWRYSGGGYTVIQKMVEDVTGLAFPEYIDEQILMPMGMASSTFRHALPEALKERASAAFDEEGKMYPEIYNDYPEKAAAGLWTTPSDLAVYAMHMQAIMAGKVDGILKKSTVETIFTKHTGDWGLGPALSEAGRQLVFGHDGKNLGFTNDFKAFVNKGEGMIVMSNGDNAYLVNQEIMTAISEHYEMETNLRTGIDAISLSLDELNAFTGQFKLTTDVDYVGDFILKLSVIDAKLRVKSPDVDQLARLVPTDSETFVSTGSGNRFVFSKDEMGEYSGFLVSGEYEYVRIQ